MRFVITGGPCSGKTTTILALERKGFCVLHEVARETIKEMGEKAFTDRLEFQRRILIKQIEGENKLPKNKPCFLDRGRHDGIAYLRYYGITIPKHFIKLCKEVKYTKVFMLELLPNYSQDRERREARNEAEKIQREILKIYKEFGYDVIKVPVMSVEERVEFILKYAGLLKDF